MWWFWRSFIYNLKSGIEVTLVVSNQAVRDYLEAIGLFEFCSQNYLEPSEIIEIPSFTAMPFGPATFDWTLS